MLILNVADLKAQLTFEGAIFDLTSSLPIEGANILIKNTNKGTFTDLYGNFKIQIDLLPVTLIITHLGYTNKEIQVVNDNQKIKTIYLDPSYNILDGITVRPVDEEVSISNVKEYSILDFEIFDESIMRLERHGTKTNIITLTDLIGKKKVKHKLEKIKGVSRLFKSCNNNFYLVCSNFAIRLFASDLQIDLGPKISIDTFSNFIETCKLRIGNKLYYQVELHNGLKRNISSYDLKSQKYNLFKSISNQSQLQNYFDDLGIINESQTISNIKINDTGENERIRNLQENGDFYLNVFYKPEFPIYLGIDNEQMVLFNHIESKIQKYNIEDSLLSEIKIDYVSEKTWLKILLIDQVTNKPFAIYNHKKGIAIKEINLQTGTTELKAVIQSKSIQYRNMKMQNGYLFYLKKGSSASRNKELMKYKIY